MGGQLRFEYFYDGAASARGGVRGEASDSEVSLSRRTVGEAVRRGDGRTGGGTDLCEAAARVRHPDTGRKLCTGFGNRVSRGEGAAYLLRRRDEGNALLASASSD